MASIANLNIVRPEDIEPQLWFTPIHLDQGVELLHANTYIARTIASYTRVQLDGDDLHGAFLETFEEWTPEIFGILEDSIRAELRKYFRERGVDVPIKRHNQALAAIATENQYPEQHKGSGRQTAPVIIQ